MTNLMVIGCGPHARSFYFPSVERHFQRFGARIVVAVDLLNQKDAVETYLRQHDSNAVLHLFDGFAGNLGENVEKELDALVEKHAIEGVIVSTDPLSHRNYAEWVIRRGLHLLLDKPITTRQNAAIDPNEASGIEEDYLTLLQAYEREYPRSRSCFIVCTHRRYHPGFSHALRLIEEVSSQTGCPVTNIGAYHCDGQWRLPSEMVTQRHHSYFDGFGKVSHSGYHFLDWVIRAWRAGTVSGKTADEMEVYSAFVRPRGILKQLQHRDYSRYFGDAYEASCHFSDADLESRFSGFGEIDAESVVTFRREGEPMALASISLLHNGFSRRTWLQPGADLYKGNGRVKHESHRIHVGPFLCVQIHSYQAKDRHDICGPEDSIIGGNNHFQMEVFRNVCSSNGKTLEVISLEDITGQQGTASKRLAIEQVKDKVVTEFLNCIQKSFRRDQLQSDIADHFMSVRLMSAVYRSHAQRIHGGSPVTQVSFGSPTERL